MIMVAPCRASVQFVSRFQYGGWIDARRNRKGEANFRRQVESDRIMAGLRHTSRHHPCAFLTKFKYRGPTPTELLERERE